MQWKAVALVALVLVSGCSSGGDPAGEAEELEASEANESAQQARERSWTVGSNISLGRVVAAGAHSPVGDTIVGVRSHDQCPSASFSVSPGTERVEISFDPSLVDPGVGTYTVAIGSPDAVTYLTPPLSEPRFVDDSPASGPWAIELKPQGATANQMWPFEVALDGTGPLLPALEMVKDRDCLL